MWVGEAKHDWGLSLCLVLVLLFSCPALVTKLDPSFFCWAFDFESLGDTIAGVLVAFLHALSVSILVVGALWGRWWVWCWDLLLVMSERSSNAPNATLTSALDLAFTTTWIWERERIVAEDWMQAHSLSSHLLKTTSWVYFACDMLSYLLYL